MPMLEDIKEYAERAPVSGGPASGTLWIALNRSCRCRARIRSTRPAVLPKSYGRKRHDRVRRSLFHRRVHRVGLRHDRGCPASKKLRRSFGAAPSVALATLAMAVFTHEASYAAVQSRSMMAGAIALAAYSGVVCQLLIRAEMRAAPATLLSTVVWLVVGFGLLALVGGNA